MKHRRKAFFVLPACIIVAMSTLFAPSAEAKEWKSVTIATEGSYEPWNLTRPDGKIDGFEPELIQNVCMRIKIECKFTTQDFDGLIPGLRAGKFDVLMDALSITPDRLNVIAFSRPYASTPAAFVSVDSKVLPKPVGQGAVVRLTGDDKTDKRTISEFRSYLKGKTIGIQSGTIYTKFINDNFKDIATIRTYKTAAEHDLDLVAGRIDVAFDDATYFVSALAKPENKALGFTGPKVGGPIWGPGEALGFRKSDADLRAKFDAGIAAALADGTAKALSEKWFKIDIAP